MASYTPPASFTTTQTLFNTPSSPASMDITPSSLDTIPALASILTRLQTTSTTANAPGNSPHPSASQSQTQTVSQTQSQTPSALKDLINPFSTTPISTKDIPAATDGIKHRLQKARVQVSQLPDMERSIEEQEEEIRELEKRIQEQRGVLRNLRVLGAGLAGGIKDEEMQMG